MVAKIAVLLCLLALVRGGDDSDFYEEPQNAYDSLGEDYLQEAKLEQVEEDAKINLVVPPTRAEAKTRKEEKLKAKKITPLIQVVALALNRSETANGGGPGVKLVPSASCLVMTKEFELKKLREKKIKIEAGKKAGKEIEAKLAVDESTADFKSESAKRAREEVEEKAEEKRKIKGLAKEARRKQAQEAQRQEEKKRIERLNKLLAEALRLAKERSNPTHHAGFSKRVYSAAQKANFAEIRVLHLQKALTELLLTKAESSEQVKSARKALAEAKKVAVDLRAQAVEEEKKKAAEEKEEAEKKAKLAADVAKAQARLDAAKKAAAEAEEKREKEALEEEKKRKEEKTEMEKREAELTAQRAREAAAALKAAEAREEAEEAAREAEEARKKAEEEKSSTPATIPTQAPGMRLPKETPAPTGAKPDRFNGFAFGVN